MPAGGSIRLSRATDSRNDAPAPKERALSEASTTPVAPSAGRRAARYAGYVFWLMFLINLVNYFDRFIFGGLSPQIQATLHLNDFLFGVVGAGFIVLYTLVALLGGFLADRVSRNTVVGLGVGIWSIASFATGAANNFLTMFGIRTVLGIGEGTYYPAGTPLLGAYFAPSRRPRVFARWTVGALLGGAIGFLVAGFFKQQPEAWRNAFYFTGVPGLILAFLIWRTPNKVRHEDDPTDEHVVNRSSSWQRFIAYLRIPTVRTIILTQAFGFFASGAAAYWFVIYVDRTFVTGAAPSFPTAGLPKSLEAVVAGAILLVGGILGTLYGSRLGSRLSKRYSGGLVLAGGLGYLLAAPSAVVTLGAPYVLNAIPAYTAAPQPTRLGVGLGIFCVGGLATAFFLNVFQGPLTAALLEVVVPSERAGVGGTGLAFSHLLGDSYATALVGGISSLLTQHLGGDQLGLSMLITFPVFLVASGIIGIRGSRHYAADLAAVGATVSATLGTPVTPAH
jgi:predicted MFS family arabinose efflux permease